MSNWTLTNGLQNLRAQIDAAFPGRDKTSDGTIGDAAHQAETSGHNPDDTPGSKAEWNGDQDDIPEVRAEDIDSDLQVGHFLGHPAVTAQQLVDHLRKLPGLDTVIRYMIYDRTMYHQRDGFAPTPYTGASAHTEHIHFSGAWTQAADNDTSFDYRLEELAMPSAEDIAKATAEHQVLNPFSGKMQPLSDIWRYTPSRTPHEATWAKLNVLATTVAAMAAGQVTEADIAALRAAVDQVDDNVVATLTGGTDDQVAAALKAALGDRAAAVGALLVV